MIMRLPPSTPYGSSTDESLIRQYWENGDQQVMAELFRRYALPIFQVCRRFIEEEDLCRDMVMSTFEKCMSTPPPARLRSVGRWLKRIARNTCLDHLRHRHQRSEQRRIFAGLQDPFVHLHEPEPPPPPLKELLYRLKTEQRLCLELFFFQGKSYEQIAQLTPFSLTEIKSHLQNGKRRLRILLEQSQKDRSGLT